MDPADEAHQEEEAQAIDNILPVMPTSPVYLQVDEVPIDQLVSSENEQEENHDEQMEQDIEQGVQLGQAALINDIQVVQNAKMLEEEQGQATQPIENQVAQVADDQIAVQELVDLIVQGVQGQAAEIRVDQAAKDQVAIEGVQVHQAIGDQEFLDENEFFQALIAEGVQHTQSQLQNYNIQIGAALTRFEGRDPAWSQAMNAEATRLWARFFSSGNSYKFNVSISTAWANFFIVLLLSQENIFWTKQLLSSKLVPILNSNNIGVIDFSIPPTCPQNNSLCLAVSEEAGLDHGKETNTKEASSPSSRKRNGKRSTALVETKVRRGPRMRDSAKGFKLSGCTNKK